jgi:hypothetical protein
MNQFERARTVPRLCEFYPGICLTSEEKARKNLNHGKKNLRLLRREMLTGLYKDL